MRILFAFILLAVANGPAQAAWLEATTKHFRIYSEGKPEALTLFANKVERFDAMLRKRVNVPAEENPQKLTIFLLRSNEQVAKLQGSKGTLGFYRPRSEGSFAVANRERGDGTYSVDADTVLFHEYAHHFMLRHFPVAYPAWYVEGFAEFVSTTDFTAAGLAQMGKPPYYRGFGLIEHAPIPARQLVTSDVSDFKSLESIDAFYGRSWLLTHYLSYEKKRAGQLTAYLKAINSGVSSADAATKSFGDLALLDADLKAYLNRRKLTYSQAVEPTPVPGEVKVRALDAAHGALVMHRLALMRDPNSVEAAALIAPLQRLVEQNPTAEGHRLLAEAQFAAEKFDDADASADAALKIDPAFSRALIIKAWVAMRRYTETDTAGDETIKKMRALIVKANRADTDDPLPLIAYHRSFALQGARPTQTALDGIKRAYEMVPEAVDVRMDYAYSLARQQKWDAAIRLVETVAYAPHQEGGSGLIEFLDRLKKAKAGDKESLDALR